MLARHIRDKAYPLSQAKKPKNIFKSSLFSPFGEVLYEEYRFGESPLGISGTAKMERISLIDSKSGGSNQYPLDGSALI